MARTSGRNALTAKWAFPKVIMFIVVLGVAGGCANRDLSKAKMLNTVAAYDDFLMKHPKHSLSEEAKDLKEPLLWEAAMRTGTIAAFDGYLKTYPRGRFASEAQKLKETLFWEAANKERTITGFATYLEKYPKGKFASEAIQKKEALTCEYVRRKDTVKDYLLYLEEYPDGECAPRAVRLVLQLSSPNEEERDEAADLLSELGEELTKAIVEEIVNLMREGRESWSKHLYRQGHCTWYEYTTVKYYAAKSLQNMKSPHVTDKIVEEARIVRNNDKSKRRVTDPGWICY